jgi:outer membrane protein assembly factor BamA
MLGAGVDTYYGSGYAGQCVAVFSDLLGNHQITVAADIQGNLIDYTHFFASYLNLEHTINYGVGGFYNRDYSSSDVFGDSLFFFDTDAGFILTASFPFSMFSRLELDATYQNLFREPYVYSGTLEKDTTRSNQTYNILAPTLSYVYDDILWGITGPLNGTRSEATIEVSPPVKHVNSAFLSFDLDFRKYFHVFKRFVWANKIAFGSSVPLGGQQSSARKYFLGGNENWLFFAPNEEGYRNNVNNFFYSQIVVPFRGWNYLDLIGTNYAVINTEFRFPFIKEFSIAWPLQISLRYVNGAVFADIGNAWNKEDEFKNVPLPKHIYGGVGYGLRANLGIFVLRYDYAWKTDWNTFLNSPISYVSLGAEF